MNKMQYRLALEQSQRDSMKPLIAAALDIASRAVLDLPPASGNRAEQTRTWFVLDELPLLGKIASLGTLLTNGSKHGAAVVAGLQTVAQLREAYGQHQAQTILATLGTWLTLRVSDPETADYMSRNIGDEEIRRVVASGGTSSKTLEFGSQQSENWGEQYTSELLGSKEPELPVTDKQPLSFLTSNP
jgi:type IV secretory pathway TraG/TraD family ATPase VirD4